MEVKEAIAAAKRYISEIYADEQVTNFGLEEIEHPNSAGNLDNHCGLFSTLEHASHTSAGSFGEPWRSVTAEKVLQNHHNY